jgi:non-specific serine/threonine protein kinase
LLETLARYLATHELLLILDNCEHLLTACVELILVLLQSCPRLHILATSRAPLGIAAEVTWLVPSLSLPASAPLASEGMQFDAVRLFVERATLVLPAFALTAQNAAAVALICRRLDGMPLAIELAAAWVRLLAPEQIAARLDNRFALLTAGNRTALIPRHQALRATIDWSHDLLAEQERALFYRLSVFAGGFTLEAAEAIGAGDGIEKRDMLDLLSRLVDKSLVVAETQGASEARYHLLETIRQYANEKLLASGEVERVHERHLAFYLALAEEAEPHLREPIQLRWMKELEAEHDNLRGALDWSLGKHGQAETAQRLAGALADFWLLQSRYTEGKDWLRRALARDQPGPAAIRAKALAGAGWVEFWLGGLERPRSFFAEAAGLYRTLGAQRDLARALIGWGNVALTQGEAALAAGVLEEALALAQSADDQWAIAHALRCLGGVARLKGDDERAWQLYEECLAIQRGLGDRGYLAVALNNAAVAAYARADYRRAAQLWVENLKVRQEFGPRLHLRYTLSGLASVAAVTGQPALAARLNGAVEAVNRAMGAQWHPRDQVEGEQELAALRAQLGEAEFSQAWAEGLAMPTEHAIELALGVAAGLEGEPQHVTPWRVGAPDPRLAERLNEREIEVLSLIAAGFSNREIADRLVLAVSTVKWHINNLFAKLGVRSRTQAVAHARELGLL